MIFGRTQMHLRDWADFLVWCHCHTITVATGSNGGGSCEAVDVSQNDAVGLDWSVDVDTRHSLLGKALSYKWFLSLIQSFDGFWALLQYSSHCLRQFLQISSELSYKILRPTLRSL